MRRVKIALTGLAIAGVATGGFLRWQTSASRLEYKALQLYLQGDSRQAYEQLVPLEHQVSPAHLLLLQAYTLRDSELIGRSSQRLLQGIQLIQENSQQLSGHDKHILLELGLNLAFNGYITQDNSIFEQGLQIAQGVDPAEPWIFALQALQAQQNRDFILASQLADKASKRKYLSKWMQKPFSEVFGKHWDQITHARALVELGKTVSARELMSQIPKVDSTKDQLRLLNGLIQIKEGQLKPVDMAQGYFQLAYVNLKNLPMQRGEPFAGDYNEIGQAFSKQGLACLKSGLIDEVSFYISALSNWHGKNYLVPIAQSYIDWLAGEEFIESPIPDLVANARLNTLVQTPEWTEVLHSTLIAKLNDALDQKHWDAVEQFWMLIVASADTTPALVGQLEKVVESYIDRHFQSLLQEIAKTGSPDILEPALRDLHQLLPLLAQMESGDGDYQKFLQKLVDQASATLLGSPINPVSNRVFSMLAHSTSAPHPDQLLSLIRDKISKRFIQARNVRDMEAMANLFDIAVEVGVDAIPSYSKESVANMLADTRYMLESDQVKEAQAQLRWILKLDPENSQARLLLGSSYFTQGNFEQAASLLQTIKKPSNEIRQILAICYLRSGAGNKALSIIDQIRQDGLVVGDRLLLESSLYLIEQKQWRQALDQLTAIRQKVPDVWVYMMACSYRLNDSRGVWQNFNQLPPAMRANRLITALTLRKIDSQELWGIANSIMETALSVAPEKTVITPTAKEFLEKNFEPFELDLSTAAAHYLQGSRQDPERALHLLQNTDIVDWRVQTEKALALLQLGLPVDARQELAKVDSLNLDEEHFAYWLVMSQALRQTADYIACDQLLNKLASSLGTRQEIAIERAKLYYETLRLDLCLGELESWIKNANLETHLLYLDCLVKTGHFDRAIKQANLVSQLDHSAWTVWRMNMIMYPAWQATKMHWQLPTRNLFELLKPEEKGLSLQAMIKMGEINLARNWAEQFQSELQDNFESKLARMELALINNDTTLAQKLRQELVKYPNRTLDQSLKLINWLEILADDSNLQALVNSVRDPLVIANGKSNKTASGQSTLMPDLANGESLVSYAANLALARVYLDKRSAIDEVTVRRVEAIRNICLSLRSDKGPIHCFWLGAEAQLILGELFQAQKDFEQCIKSCPSLLQPYLRVAEILASQKSWPAAIAMLHETLKLHPNHPWIELDIAKYEFEKNMQAIVLPGSTQAPVVPNFESAQQWLSKALSHAPYLAEGHVLAGRIYMRSMDWKNAYEQLMLADTLKPGSRDLLTLLSVAIEQRIAQEGTRVEWEQQLLHIQRQLYFNKV